MIEAMQTLRVLVVEDEPVAREALVQRLAREPNVQVVGSAADGPAAIAAILAHAPDVVFLDIEIPPPNGFEVLETVAPLHLPAVVFVTAFDQFAVQAFDVHALDYLLKPVDQERVQRALARARHAVQEGAEAAHRRLGEFLDGGSRTRQRLVARLGDSYHVVRVDDVDWLEAEGNYVRLHTAGGTHLMRSTLRDLEGMLDPKRFVRIHRGTVVNIERVASIRPVSHGDCDVILRSGRSLRWPTQQRYSTRYLL